MSSRSKRTLLLVCSLAFAGVLSGCRGRGGAEQTVPSVDAAQQALEAVLTAWKNGQTPGKIGSAPVVQAVDTQWLQGQKLQSYEIVGQAPGKGPVWFSVKLTLDRPRRVIETRYAVLGGNPIWVFRDHDYAKVATHSHESGTK